MLQKIKLTFLLTFLNKHKVRNFSKTDGQMTINYNKFIKLQPFIIVFFC